MKKAGPTFGLPTDEESKASTPVMMYCTGGIRCEYFSARLKAQGFQKVYKLQGGVQHYGNAMGNRALADERGEAGADAAGKQEGGVEDSGRRPEALKPCNEDDRATGAAAAATTHEPEAEVAHVSGSGDAEETTPHWRGALFVFDRRNTLRFGAEATDERRRRVKPIGQCMHCGTPTEAFINCANIDCNHLHLVCPTCLTAHRGFCTEACKTAPRRRPLDLLASTEGGAIDFERTIAATQGPRPGAADPNKLSSFKPHNLPRGEYDADKHARD